MNAVEALDELQRKARHDDKLREQFIKTRDAEDSLGAFCSVVRRVMNFIRWILCRQEMNFMPQ